MEKIKRAHQHIKRHSQRLITKWGTLPVIVLLLILPIAIVASINQQNIEQNAASGTVISSCAGLPQGTGAGQAECIANTTSCPGSMNKAYTNTPGNNQNGACGKGTNSQSFVCCVASQGTGNGTVVSSCAGLSQGTGAGQAECIANTTSCPGSMNKAYTNTPGNNQNGACGKGTTSQSFVCCIAPQNSSSSSGSSSSKSNSSSGSSNSQASSSGSNSSNGSSSSTNSSGSSSSFPNFVCEGSGTGAGCPNQSSSGSSSSASSSSGSTMSQSSSGSNGSQTPSGTATPSSSGSSASSGGNLSGNDLGSLIKKLFELILDLIKALLGGGTSTHHTHHHHDSD